MGDKVTQAPIINHGGFEVRHGVTGDTSCADMQYINVSEKVKSFQSGVGSPLVGGTASREVGRLSSDENFNAVAVDITKDHGRVAKAKAQRDTSLIDTISPVQKRRHVTGFVGVSHHTRGIKSSAIKVPTLTAPISNKNQSIKASALGVPVLPSRHNREDEIRNNAANLGPRSASTGNLATESGTTSPVSSPRLVRKGVKVSGQSPLVNNQVKNQSPRPFRKDYRLNVTSVQSEFSSGKSTTTVTTKIEGKPHVKPPKPVKPFNLSHRKVHGEPTVKREPLPCPNRKSYVCSNGVKLGPGTSLRLPGGEKGKPGSSKSKLPPDSPKSPRSSSPRSPAARGRTSFFKPTSSSLAKAKDKSPGRNLHKPSPAKDTPKHTAGPHHHTKQSVKILHSGKMHGDSSLKVEPRNSLIMEKSVSNPNKLTKGHLDSQDCSDIVMKDVQQSLSITLEDEKAKESEKVASEDHVPKEIDKAWSEVQEKEMKTATRSEIMTNNNSASSDNSEGEHDKKNISTMIAAFEDIQLRESALKLNAKLEQENAKMRNMYFRKMEVEKEHNYAQFPSDDKAKSKAVDDGPNANNTDDTAQKTDCNDESKALHVDREEKVYYNVVNTRDHKIIPSTKTVIAHDEAKTPGRTSKNIDTDIDGVAKEKLEEASNEKVDISSSISVHNEMNTIQSNPESVEENKLPISGISAVVSSKSDENCNQVSFVTLKVGGHGEGIVKKEENTGIPKRNTYPGSLAAGKKNIEPGTTAEELNDKCNSGYKTDLLIPQVNTCPSMDTVVQTSLLTQQDNDSENYMIVASSFQGDKNHEATNESIIITTDDECHDYESIVENVLWTDDIDKENIDSEIMRYESDEDEGPSGLASSITMFFEAYEAQLRNQGTPPQVTPPNKGTNNSPPYIAGLSPVSISSHHLRLPGNNNNNGERALSAFRSRSNSICNETIFEERESQSSDEEENSSKGGLENIPGMLRNIPGRIGSNPSDKSSTYTESSIFQSETSEDDVKTSINLDDWWQTWTMGSQRKPHNDENHDTSDLEKLKIMTSRMNLQSRRPSVLEWKEKYLDKPPFLWNHVAGKPPVLSPSDKEPEQIAEQNVKDSNEWTGERIEKINDAISWIRTELVSNISFHYMQLGHLRIIHQGYPTFPAQF